MKRSAGQTRGDHGILEDCRPRTFTSVCPRPDRPPMIPESLDRTEQTRPKKRRKSAKCAMESLLARAEEATKSLSRPEAEAPTWPPPAALGAELFARVQKEHSKAKAKAMPLGVESARRLAAAAAAALRLSWAIGLASAEATEWQQFLEDKLQEALQVLAADPQWMSAGLGCLPKELTKRKSSTESVEALLRHLDFFDQLLFRL